MKFLVATIGMLGAVLAAYGKIPEQDSRNTDIPHTNTHFRARSYTSLDEWQQRAARLRKQVLSAAGLLPLPERNPLRYEIFGRIENKDYSIEKVFIETMPGYYLAGNLFRPLGRTGKFPGILAPHGHATYGRLENGPLFSVQARGINKARQGYVVFAYDMVGYNDTIQTPHVFGGEREQLWSFGPLGLQTWNSIRALDFLQSLPDVNPNEIGVTGESGGGTQTFLICAVDDRIKYSAPVNMISLIMQGGSPCENAPNLRVATNNVEIASLMAPKPMLMVSATGDWTKNTPTEEYPAVKAIYGLYGKPENVDTIQIDAPHNYNKPSREAVYRFFAKHILHDPNWASYSEKAFRAEKLQDLMVFHARPLPDNALKYEQIAAQWIERAQKQNASITDRSAMRERLMYSLMAEQPQAVEHEISGEHIVLGRQGKGDRVPGIWIPGGKQALLVVHPEGAAAGRNSKQASDAISKKQSVLLIDAFQTGSAAAPRDRSTRYFLTFNKSDDANRVQDILTALAFLKSQGASGIRLAGIGKAAVWATFAAALTDAAVTLDADLGSFQGSDEDFIKNFFVPGIQRAGGLKAALALAGTSR